MTYQSKLAALGKQADLEIADLKAKLAAVTPTAPPLPPPPSPSPVTTAPTGEAAGLKAWVLKFEDTFSGSAIDTSKWNVADGATMNKVTCRPGNVSVADGNAILQLSDAATGSMLCSGTVDGRGVNHFLLPVGAYTEARCWFPSDGTNLINWSAWWASGAPWPSAGEHDIAEVLSGKLTVNYHSDSGAHNQGVIPGSWGNGWHVYGLHRKSGSADVYWDGVRVKTYATDDNGTAGSLILNCGKAGTATAYGASGALKVDYVRAWA